MKSGRSIPMILAGALLFSPCALAGGFHPSVAASYLHYASSASSASDQSGFEIGAAELTFPDPDRAFELGPRASFVAAEGGGQSRRSAYLGAQASLWIMNLFGPGLGADWVPVSTLDSDHYRVEFLLDTRLLHVGTGAALALRLGVPYEQSLRWGFRAGVTLEFFGI